jgi:Glycosyltransferase family 87
LPGSPAPLVSARDPITSCLTLLLGGLVFLFIAKSQALAGHDFLEYWASARLLVHHADPYSKDLLAQVEGEAGVGSGPDTLVGLNPPYSLAFFLPLAFFTDPRSAGIFWTVVLFTGIALSLRTHWFAYLYPPVFACLLGGQSAALLLLGVTLFLKYHRAKPWAAGLSLLLLGLKPHLFVLFGIALLAWVMMRKAYAILWTPAAGLVILSAIVTPLRPQVWADYLRMGRTHGIAHWFLPCVSGWLRRLVHPSWVWLQILPLAVGCVWALWYFRRHRTAWDWTTHGSLLLMVSLAVSPYEWFTDEIAILPAIIAGISRGRSLVPFAVFSTISGSELLAGIIPGTGYYVWNILAWIGWWISGSHSSRYRPHPAQEAEPLLCSIPASTAR